jgi:hypothetical protein
MVKKEIAPKSPSNGILIFPDAFLLQLLSEQSLSKKIKKITRLKADRIFPPR